MEKLTKEEAIRRHRLLWAKIADECEGKDALDNVYASELKQKVFSVLGWVHIRNYCWCCEYSRTKSGYNCNDCNGCPIQWPNGSCVDPHTYDFKEGAQNGYLYDIFEQSVRDGDENSAKKIALEIANLPEKN